MVAVSVAVDTVAGTATFTLKKPLADVGFGRFFWLRICKDLIPTGTLQVLLTDVSGSVIVVRNHLGDLLRTDSLKRWEECRCECDALLRAYLGSDDLHVTVFNRMCKSAFVPVPVVPAVAG